MTESLHRTSLYMLHQKLGARFVPFAGYEMPVQFEQGLMAEHLFTRSSAGCFDISHMGQIRLASSILSSNEILQALESLVPADMVSLKPNRQRYALFTDPKGGILDDLMVAHMGDWIMLIVNAACKNDDFKHLRVHLPDSISVEFLDDRSLIAVQGPKAASVIQPIFPEIASMRFMDSRQLNHSDYGEIYITRSGYTGEDGFEISIDSEYAVTLAELLLENKEVKPVGLGARDTLRLEAGLCLYGQDITRKTTPVEASLEWSIQKARRSGGIRAGHFPGADIILAQLERMPEKKRVGLKPQGRAPIRHGALLYADAGGEHEIGYITSGTFSPSLSMPIAMGYVASVFSQEGTVIYAELRGKFVPVQVSPLPFVSPHYVR